MYSVYNAEILVYINKEQRGVYQIWTVIYLFKLSVRRMYVNVREKHLRHILFYFFSPFMVYYRTV